MAKIINKTIHIFTVLFFITALSSALLHVFAPVEVQAAQLDVSITSSDGADCSRINDGYFSFDDKDGSTMAFDAGTQITISASEPIRALYIK